MNCANLCILILQAIVMTISRFMLTRNTAVSLLDLGIGNGGSYTCKNSWIYYHIKGL